MKVAIVEAVLMSSMGRIRWMFTNVHKADDLYILWEVIGREVFFLLRDQWPGVIGQRDTPLLLFVGINPWFSCSAEPADTKQHKKSQSLAYAALALNADKSSFNGLIHDE